MSQPVPVTPDSAAALTNRELSWLSSARRVLALAEALEACLAELWSQQELVASLVEEQLRPALRDLGTPVLDVRDLDPSQRDFLARFFADCVEPVLTPLAADAAHPFPFISNLGLNLAVLVTGPGHRDRRFVRIKVPASRPRWLPLPGNPANSPCPFPSRSLTSNNIFHRAFTQLVRILPLCRHGPESSQVSEPPRFPG